MGKEIMANSVLWTPIGRLSFVKFFPPEKSKKPNPETGEHDLTWTASIVFDPEESEKNKQRFADIRKAEKLLMQEKWHGKKPGGYKPPYRDGNDYDLDDPNYAWYEDKYILTVRSKNIEVVPHRKIGEKNGKAILEPCTKKTFFSGVWGCATIKLFGFDVETDGGRSRGISASLQNIYLTKTDEPLGFQRRSAQEDFEDADDDDFETFDSEDLMNEDDDDDEDFVPKKKKGAKDAKSKKRSRVDDEDF